MGAFISNLGEPGFTNLKVETAIYYLNSLGICYLVATLVSLIYLVYLRRLVLIKAADLERTAYTPSDFCIMGTNMKFDNCSPENIEREIRETFNRDYDGAGDKIVYTNATYDIDNFYTIASKLTDL
jgi:hypothetical protein